MAALILGLLVASVPSCAQPTPGYAQPTPDYAQPTRYEAMTMIQIRSVVPSLLGNDRPLNELEYNRFVNTQIVLLKSLSVLDRALEQPEVAQLPIVLEQKDKRAWLAKQLQVERASDTEIIYIRITTNSAEASEKINNAVIEAYFSFIDEIARRSTSVLIDNLRVEERRHRQVVQALQDSIRRKTREAAMHGIAVGDRGMSIGLVQGESLARDVVLAEAKLTAMKVQRKGIIERMENPIPMPISLLIQLNPELKFLNEQRSALVQQRMLAETFSTPDDPQIVPMDRQIELIDERVRTIASSADISTAEAAMQHFLLQDEAALFQLDQDIRAQKILVAELANKYQQQRIRSIDRAAVPDIALEIAQLERANRTLSLIEERIQTVTTEMRAPSQITPLSSAILSITPSLETVAMIVGAGFIVFFFLPLLCVLCYHCCCQRN